MPVPVPASDDDKPKGPKPSRPLGDRIGELLDDWLPKPGGPEPIPQPVAVPAGRPRGGLPPR